MPLAQDALPLSPGDVRRRFRWAARQGHPAWLWPEVPVQAWREALSAIEAAAAAVLRHGQCGRRLEGDPAVLGLAGYTSGLGPLLGWWIEQGQLGAEEPVAAIFALHLRHNRRRAERMQAGARGVVEALARRGVDVVVLKGLHTGSAYFPEAGTRPASDIDLLVSARDAPAAEEVLSGLGFAMESRRRRESAWRPPGAAEAPLTLSFVHADDPWTVDLHNSLDLHVSAGAPLARLDRLAPMQAAAPWELHAGAGTLSQPALILHLAVHAGMGLQNLTLARLVELVLVIRRDLSGRPGAWSAVLQAGDEAGLLGYAWPALSLAEQLCPGTVPAHALQMCAGRTPAAVRRVVARLTPATAQRIDHSSLQEHFMWSAGWAGRFRQLADDLAPTTESWSQIWRIYEQRLWRLVRGRLTA